MRCYLSVFIFSASVALGYNYPCVDIHFSPYSGAENLIFLEKNLEKLDRFFFPSLTASSPEVEPSPNLEELSDTNRWHQELKGLLFWLPFGASCAVTQHEVFGHGYRIRDLGSEYAKVTGYGMYVFGGVTNYSATNKLTASQMLTIDVAGLEADAILSNRLRMTWLQEGKIDGRQFPMYSMSSLSFFGYTTTVKKNPTSIKECWNDISSFLFFLNRTYPDSYLNYTRVRNLSFLNLLDPFLWISMLAQMVHVQYDRGLGIPMFSLGSVKYLPSIKVVLTPFGLQGYLDNYFVFRDTPTYFYMKWGKHGENTYYGLGVENRKILQGKLGSLGARFDFWHQPRVLFEPGALSANEIGELPEGAPTPPLYPQSLLTEKITGTAVYLITSYEWVRSPILFFSELGYKTDGYLPGEALRSAPILRGGLSGRF